MIIPNDDKKPLLVDVGGPVNPESYASLASSSNNNNHHNQFDDPIGSFARALAGPSAPSSGVILDPPPTFAESAGDKALNAELANSDVYVPPGGEEPPPEFTPYEAEYFVSGSSEDIVSHDPHLNEDGEALYRFLLSQARVPPKFVVSLHGSHTEQRFRTVTHRDSKGHTHTRTESYNETVIDFDFSIDITPFILPGVIHWSVPDEEPAYRGKMYKEVDGLFALQGGPSLSSGPPRLTEDTEAALEGKARRKAQKKEIKSARAWEMARVEKGLPPWVGPGVEQDSLRNAQVNVVNVLKSSKTLREWADEYCASDKRLKEFTYKKVVYGWNISALTAAINAAVKSTYYDGDFGVKFRVSQSKIHIRPNSLLARMLSRTWVKVILWILLIYPFVWLYKRYSKHGGGRWEVCGGAFAVKQWRHVDDDPSAPPPPFSDSQGTRAASANHSNLVGLKEGEWFQMWESTIKRAVTGRLKSREALSAPSDRPTTAAMMLDGYRI